MKSAIIYARYSSEKQTEQSIEGQLRVCYEFAKKNDLTIVDEYIDRATTGTNDNRYAFQKMLADSDKAKWEIVLVYALDRFGRNSIEVAINKQRLKKNNKILISATQKTSTNIDGTQNLDGIILENVMIGIAEYYSAELSQKVKRGQNESRRKGNFCGGFVLYGYKIVDKKPVIDENESTVVRLIFERYNEGKIVREILEELQQMGLTRRGKPFLKHVVYAMLQNEKYIGMYHFNGESFPDYFPPIIQKDLFESIQVRLRKNQLGSASKAVDFLLKGKLFCGLCGHKMNGESGTSHTGAINYYYKCSVKKKNTKNCPQKSIKKDWIEKAVFDAIMENINTPVIRNVMIERIMQVYEIQRKDDSLLKTLTEERRKVQVSLDNLLQAIEEGITTKTTKERMVELENRIEILDHKIASEKLKEEDALLTREMIEEYFVTALEFNKKQLFDFLLKKVEVFENKIVIYFRYRTKNDPDEPETTPRGFYLPIKSTMFTSVPPVYKKDGFQTVLFV